MSALLPCGPYGLTYIASDVYYSIVFTHIGRPWSGVEIQGVIGPLFRQCLQQARTGLTGLWGASQAEPKVVWLQGESRRLGVDQRESAQSVEQALQYLTPTPFRVDLGEAHLHLCHCDLALPLRWAWLERGYPIPPIVIGENPELGAEEISIALFGVEHIRLTIPSAGLLPREAVQLEIARAVVASLKRVVNRDFVRVLAEERGVSVQPQHLGRLSKYFRCCLQAGLALPAPQEWPSLAQSGAFDEIGHQPQVVHYRPPLSLERRKFLLFQSVPDECQSVFGPRPGLPGDSLLEQLQAIEEFFGAARQTLSLPGLELSCRSRATLEPHSMGIHILKIFLLQDRLALFQQRCRQSPEKMHQRILSLDQRPAPTMPAFQKIALLLQVLGNQGQPLRAFLQSYLGTLSAVQGTAEQIERVLNDSVLA